MSDITLKLKSIKLTKSFDGIILRKKMINEIYIRSKCWLGNYKSLAQKYPDPPDQEFLIHEQIFPMKAGDKIEFEHNGITLFHQSVSKHDLGKKKDIAFEYANKLIDINTNIQNETNGYKGIKTDAKSLGLFFNKLIEALNAKAIAESNLIIIENDMSNYELNFIIQVLECDYDYRKKGETIQQAFDILSPIILSTIKNNDSENDQETDEEDKNDESAQIDFLKSITSPIFIADIGMGVVNIVAKRLAQNKDDLVFTFIGSIKGNTSDNVKLNSKFVDLEINVSGYKTDTYSGNSTLKFMKIVTNPSD